MRRTMCRLLAGRCRVECLTDWRTAVGSSAATCQPFRSRVLLAVGAGPTASKQLYVTWAIVEGWRSIATRDDSKLRGSDSRVKIILLPRWFVGSQPSCAMNSHVVVVEPLQVCRDSERHDFIQCFQCLPETLKRARQRRRCQPLVGALHADPAAFKIEL